MYLRTLLLAGVIAVSSSAAARDVNGNYAVFGVGSEPCSNYLSARDAGADQEQMYVEWISGHLSAYNLLLVNTYNIMGDTDAFDMLARLDSYCRRYRDTLLVQAIAVQVESLYETRANLSPSHSGWQDWLGDVRKGGSESGSPTEP